MTSRAAAAPENCCCPVTSSPSRTAKSRNIWSTTKLVPSSLRASSSIQNGWMRAPRSVGELLLGVGEARPGLALHQQLAARQARLEQQAGGVADQRRDLAGLVEARHEALQLACPRKVNIGDWPPATKTAS
jgi:hypothetical protein